MASVYLGLVALVNEFGLTAAILRERDLTADHIAQLGGFAVALGGFFALVSIGLATPIAMFYGEPAVRIIVALLSLNFVFSGLAVLPRSLLARDLQFSRLATLDSVSNLAQIGGTLVLALLGFKYMSLVYGALFGSAAATALALWFHGHRLAWPRDFAAIRGTITIGWHIVVGRIAWYTYQSADFAIVGRVLGKTALGAYTLGWEIATVPVERVSALVGQVTPGVFSAVQHDLPAVRRYYLAIIEGLSLITFPAAIGLALTADVLIPVFLGAQWTSAIVPLRLLALYAGFRSIDTVAPQVLVYTGHSRKAMWFAVRAAVILPILFLIATRWGTAGVATVWIIAYPPVMYPVYRLLSRVLELPFSSFARALWPATAGTLLMSAMVITLRWMLPGEMDQRVGLAIMVLGGALTYAAYALLACRDRLRAVRDLLRSQ
jgi:PST family polysaccharide transporter